MRLVLGQTTGESWQEKRQKEMNKTLTKNKKNKKGNIISRAAHAPYDSGAIFMFAYSYIKENDLFIYLIILNRILRRFNSERTGWIFGPELI